jgi:hypothetical protein
MRFHAQISERSFSVSEAAIVPGPGGGAPVQTSGDDTFTVGKLAFERILLLHKRAVAPMQLLKGGG